jgi:7-carboxy-7-deazaguanine synthase
MTVTQPQQLSLLLSKDGIWDSIQGEGPRLGRITTFLRLGACNYTCEWCDTAYTWDWTGQNGIQYNQSKELVSVSLQNVVEVLREHLRNTGSLTITGGEPLLQVNSLREFLPRLSCREVNFETNGSKQPPRFDLIGGINFVVSPKLKNAKTHSWNPDILALWSLYDPRYGDVDFKFVCERLEDLEEVRRLVVAVEGRGGYIPPWKIWIMPQGITPRELTERAQILVDPVIERGWNLTTRFHQYIWSNLRAK